MLNENEPKVRELVRKVQRTEKFAHFLLEEAGYDFAGALELVSNYPVSNVNKALDWYMAEDEGPYYQTLTEAFADKLQALLNEYYTLCQRCSTNEEMFILAHDVDMNLRDIILTSYEVNSEL